MFSWAPAHASCCCQWRIVAVALEVASCGSLNLGLDRMPKRLVAICSLWQYVCMYMVYGNLQLVAICVYVYIYVCVCIFLWIYITHTHTHTHTPGCAPIFTMYLRHHSAVCICMLILASCTVCPPIVPAVLQLGPSDPSTSTTSQTALCPRTGRPAPATATCPTRAPWRASSGCVPHPLARHLACAVCSTANSSPNTLQQRSRYSSLCWRS